VTLRFARGAPEKPYKGIGKYDLRSEHHAAFLPMNSGRTAAPQAIPNALWSLSKLKNILAIFVSLADPKILSATPERNEISSHRARGGTNIQHALV